MKKLVIGILAHVDAGKTTLAESILYLSGSIRKLGRVDHKDAFLDTYELERARGITIFSKQAEFKYNDMKVSLLDTPGHVDFSAEMERTLQVLDYAILVISGTDGVQGHTETLWRLLARYRIPTFVFVNKMDVDGTDPKARMSELKKLLNDGCINFNEDHSSEAFLENLAMCDEALLDHYMDHGVISTEEISKLIAERNVFPCYFGSALKLEGVEECLDGMLQYTQQIVYPKQFGARIYKVARDEQGNRLTYMKITGGSIKVKMPLTNDRVKGKSQVVTSGDQAGKLVNKYGSSEKSSTTKESAEVWEEKVDQIRIYSGTRYDIVDELTAGAVCAVTGLSRTYPGEGIGIEEGNDLPLLEPVLNYQILLPPDCNAYSMLSKLRQLEEEDPQLHILWSDQLKEIHIQLMGEVQTEVLQSIIAERFGVDVEFGVGNIVYKETIAETVVGVGHFEPLRHYAEVHLRLDPGMVGSGLVYDSQCSEDILDRNWQRLILTHLEEKEHIGVLTGSPITDMKITLITGRAHLKHTEGGDFRQATYRAVRQGLKRAKNVLLEPYYHFKLELPSDMIGRAMTDIQRMSGSFHPPEIIGEMSVLTGTAPVATMMGYQTEVIAYTRGRGKLFCSLQGYLPCHNSEEVLEAIGYDSERDLDNPTGSVFCAHGVGFVVEWDNVESYMHMDNGWRPPEPEVQEQKGTLVEDQRIGKTVSRQSGSLQEDKELEDIFIRTFGPTKQRLQTTQNRFGYEKKASLGNESSLENELYSWNETSRSKTSSRDKSMRQIEAGKKASRKEYLLVDGYNIIFSWEDLNELAQENLDAARNKLIDILSNYQGFKKCILILVFDAYKVKGGVGEVIDYNNIHVVYTKEAETADQYIEKVTHEIAREHHVTVATSDALEQLIIMGKGAVRLSAKDLKEEIIRTRNHIQRDYLDQQPSGRSYIGEKFDDTVLGFMTEGETKPKE